jgi:hypothetical protein
MGLRPRVILSYFDASLVEETLVHQNVSEEEEKNLFGLISILKPNYVCMYVHAERIYLFFFSARQHHEINISELSAKRNSIFKLGNY